MRVVSRLHTTRTSTWRGARTSKPLKFPAASFSQSCCSGTKRLVVASRVAARLAAVRLAAEYDPWHAFARS